MVQSRWKQSLHINTVYKDLASHRGLKFNPVGFVRFKFQYGLGGRLSSAMLWLWTFNKTSLWFTSMWSVHYGLDNFDHKSSKQIEYLLKKITITFKWIFLLNIARDGNKIVGWVRLWCAADVNRSITLQYFGLLSGHLVFIPLPCDIVIYADSPL